MRVRDWSSDVCSSVLVGDLGVVAERPDLVLPVAQRRGVLVVDLDAIEQRPRASPAQALVELATEAAEAFLVIGVAKREHGVLESVQVGRCCAQLPGARACADRSEESRVGKDVVRTGRCRWGPYQKK